MIKSFEFYFDFASPYTFLAHKEIRRIEKENLIEIKYKPVLLGALLKLAGLKPLIDIPIKGKYMIKDCKLWAEKYNIDFKFNNYFPIISLTLMRCVLVAKKKGFEKKFIDKMFDGIWRENLNLNDNLILEKSLKKINVDPKKLLIEASENSIKEELKIRTNDAYNKGVFGTPTFIVNNKIFWGQDRLEFVLNEANKS
tara:strand:- start:3185 stop:3775 length:591 start_codon:yes stop_codon:yes gene_type:complete